MERRAILPQGTNRGIDIARGIHASLKERARKRQEHDKAYTELFRTCGLIIEENIGIHGRVTRRDVDISDTIGGAKHLIKHSLRYPYTDGGWLTVERIKPDNTDKPYFYVYWQAAESFTEDPVNEQLFRTISIYSDKASTIGRKMTTWDVTDWEANPKYTASSERIPADEAVSLRTDLDEIRELLST